MAGHHRAEQIELESQVRMTRRNHLVIDGLFLSSNVAMKASMAAHSQVAQIAHAELTLLVCGSRLPFFDRVRPQPTRRWAVAMLAAHAVADVECLGAHLGWDLESVARKAFLVLVGR